MIVTIAQLKKQLNIEDTFIDDDEHLTLLIKAADKAVKNYLDHTPEELAALLNSEDIEDIKLAVLMMCDHWYNNRSAVSFAQGYNVPKTFEFLLNPYKNICIV